MWKQIATGVVTLVVGFVLFQLQQGGRRGRMRKEIRDELELVKMLKQQSPVRNRLEARVNRLLERYEPQPKDLPSGSGAWASLSAGIMTVVLFFIGVRLLPEMPWWGSLILGVTIGALVAGVAAGIASVRDRRLGEPELDE